MRFLTATLLLLPQLTRLTTAAPVPAPAADLHPRNCTTTTTDILLDFDDLTSATFPSWDDDTPYNNLLFPPGHSSIDWLLLQSSPSLSSSSSHPPSALSIPSPPNALLSPARGSWVPITLALPAPATFALLSFALTVYVPSPKAGAELVFEVSGDRADGGSTGVKRVGGLKGEGVRVVVGEGAGSALGELGQVRGVWVAAWEVKAGRKSPAYFVIDDLAVRITRGC